MPVVRPDVPLGARDRESQVPKHSETPGYGHCLRGSTLGNTTDGAGGIRPVVQR
jgi:hypothetical protein